MRNWRANDDPTQRRRRQHPTTRQRTLGGPLRRPDGRRASIYEKTKREVAGRLRAAQRDAEVGLKPLDQQLTTEAFLREWLDSHVRPNVRPRTAESYSYVVTSHLLPALGKVPLAKLQPEHVSRMVRDLDKRQPALSAATVRYAYVVLRIALGRALKLGRVHRNVATLIDPPRKVKRDIVPMTADECRTFLSATGDSQHGALFRLAVTTGMRQGELLGLRWGDVDLEAGWLEVRHTLRRGDRVLAEPKTPSSRRSIALDDVTVAALRAHRLRQLELRLASPKWKDGDFAFCSRRGEPLHARVVLKAFHDALDRAGLRRRPFHQLRHGFATLMLESGEDLATISKVLGHSTLATTADFYGHLTPAISRRAAERMKDVLAG